MERKDAVYWLNNLIGNYSDYYDDALEMGIKALEQQEIVRCGECVNFAERDFCKVAGHNVHRKSNCMQVFGAERRTDE